jgi:hypothetical protein
MRVDQSPRFPADPGLLIRKLTDLFRQFGQAVNDLLEWMTGATASQSSAASATLSTIYGSTLVTVSGTTQTLPSAASNQGREVTVIQGVAGWVDIVCAGSDEVAVDGGQTTIRLDQYGASVTLRAVAATTWGIV